MLLASLDLDLDLEEDDPEDDLWDLLVPLPLDRELLLLLLDRDLELELLLDLEELREEDGDRLRSLERERGGDLLSRPLSASLPLTGSLLTGWYGPLSGILTFPRGGEREFLQCKAHSVRQSKSI